MPLSRDGEPGGAGGGMARSWETCAHSAAGLDQKMMRAGPTLRDRADDVHSRRLELRREFLHVASIAEYAPAAAIRDFAYDPDALKVS